MSRFFSLFIKLKYSFSCFIHLVIQFRFIYLKNLEDLLNFKIFKNSLILSYFHQKQLIITQNVNHFVSINMLAGSLIDKTKIKRIQSEQIHS